MKVVQKIFFIFLTFSLLSFVYKNANSKLHTNKLPVFISYQKEIPPDSIQDFLKVYLQTKKIEVINWSEVMKLFTGEIQTEMMNKINSGNFNEKTAAEIGKSGKPVCSVLAMQIFHDTTFTENYTIDSIKWYVGTMPVKDTVQQRLIYIPESNLKNNPFLVLKDFTDKVVESKLLK